MHMKGVKMDKLDDDTVMVELWMKHVFGGEHLVVIGLSEDEVMQFESDARVEPFERDMNGSIYTMYYKPHSVFEYMVPDTQQIRTSQSVNTLTEVYREKVRRLRNTRYKRSRIGVIS